MMIIVWVIAKKRCFLLTVDLAQLR